MSGSHRLKACRKSRALTTAEALQLAEQLRRDWRTERYRTPVLVLAFGGLRFGEATALRRSDVLTGGRLLVERSVRRVGGRWVVGEPKADAGHRTVPLSAAVAAVLERSTWKSMSRLLRTPPVQHQFRRLPRAQQLELDFSPRRRRHRAARTPAPRAPPHRRHSGRGDRRDHQGADAAGWATPPPPPCSASTPPTTATPKSPAPSTPCRGQPPGHRRNTRSSSTAASRETVHRFPATPSTFGRFAVPP